MATPRELVCELCWDGLFNTQAYQNIFFSLDSSSSVEDEQSRKVIQQTSSQHARDNCSFIRIRRDIASSARLSKSGNRDMGTESKTKCNWCEYIGSYSCCELDEDGKAPEYDQDLLEITLETVRVDYSTPPSAPGAGAKVLMLSLDRRDRKTGKSLVGNGSMHHAYTRVDDPAAEVVVSRPVRSDVEGQGATEQIKSWIHECESQQCGKDGGFYKDTVLPTRVIDIGLDSSRSPRVVETHGCKGVYATLSYCWGRQKNVTLRQDNIRQLQTEIDVENLPQTIQDAIAVNRKMSVPYLWVDALCIVQDDEVEKAKEIARMQDIYSCSAVTIIASSASGADEGFLSLPEDTYLINPHREPVVVPVRLAPSKFGTISFLDLNDGICYAENREPISRRAWTTQEQLLAQRKLIFTQHNHTMTWSCPHSPLARAFGGSMHLPYWPGNFSGKEEDFLRETLNLSALAPDPTALSVGELPDRDKALGCWLRLVTAYSLRSATLQVDKLNALAGIGARCYAPLLGPGYFAGVWEYGLLRQLAWKTSDFHESLPYAGVTVTRPLLDGGLSRAPSWSWASMEGGVVEYNKFPKFEKDDDSRMQEEEEWMSEVVAITTTPRFGTDNSFGEIKPGSGRITLRTKLKRAWWHPSSLSIFRKSCAPTPSRSPTSSSAESSDEESIPLPASSFEERCTKFEGEDGRATTTEIHTGEDTEDGWEDIDSSSEEEYTEQNWSEIPTFDMMTDRTIGGPFTEYVSPFKRVLRRTGPLLPDSDSEYDSASGTEETLVMPQHATDHLTGRSRDRDRTWWWLVSASLDEITTDNHVYNDEWMAQKDYEVEHVDPFVVYMLPLIVTSRRQPHGHDRGRGRPRNELVEGLLLVKDKEAINEKWGFEGRIEEGYMGKRRKGVLFKRIGRFSGCPKKEFEKVALRNVTII